MREQSTPLDKQNPWQERMWEDSPVSSGTKRSQVRWEGEETRRQRKALKRTFSLKRRVGRRGLNGVRDEETHSSENEGHTHAISRGGGLKHEEDTKWEWNQKPP